MYSLVIAEDELATRRGLVNMIKWDELGFQVDGVFSDGKDVIEYLSNHNPDVILTDIQMCQVTGVEVARFVAEQNLPVQVVFLTAYREFTFAQFAVEYHVAHYLLKPFPSPSSGRFSIPCGKSWTSRVSWKTRCKTGWIITANSSTMRSSSLSRQFISVR